MRTRTRDLPARHGDRNGSSSDRPPKRPDRAELEREIEVFRDFIWKTGNSYEIFVTGKLEITATGLLEINASKLSIKADDLELLGKNSLALRTSSTGHGGASISMLKSGDINVRGDDMSFRASSTFTAHAASDMILRGSKIKEN